MKQYLIALIPFLSVPVVYILLVSNNTFLLKTVVAILFFLSLLSIALHLNISKKESVLPSESSEMLRYTMSCRSCGWEWMSQVTRKSLAPTKCPNCNENRLEIIGWRRVKILNQENKDLRSFVKGS